MERQVAEELCRLENQRTIYLQQVGDITEELAQAMGRKDQVSVNLVLQMRQEPIQLASELMEQVRSYLLTLPEEDAARAHALLNGAPAAKGEGTGVEHLAQIVARNRRILKKLLERDKVLSVQLGGRRSFYQKFAN